MQISGKRSLNRIVRAGRWFARLVLQVHSRLGRRLAPLAMIAHLAGGDEIVPRVPASARPWDDVVNGELDVGAAAILTGEVVADKDFFAGELDSGAGASDWIYEADY